MNIKRTALSLLGVALILLTACQAKSSVCKWTGGTPRYLTTPAEELPTPVSRLAPTPVQWMIDGRTITIDKIVEGPLCNDTWRGTVYVTCNVQVYPWVEQPTFLKNCNLKIEPGTVVYVAYHNNTAYYNGCSCHTGVTAEP